MSGLDSSFQVAYYSPLLLFIHLQPCISQLWFQFGYGKLQMGKFLCTEFLSQTLAGGSVAVMVGESGQTTSSDISEGELRSCGKTWRMR